MVESILNGLTLQEFVGYAFWMTVGLLVSILSQQIDNAAPIKRSGGFSFLVLIKQNWKRYGLNALVMIIFICFMDKFADEKSNFAALTAGFTFDVLIDRILFRKK